MRKKWGIIGMLMIATACTFAGCQVKESETGSEADKQQQTQENKEKESQKSGKEYAFTFQVDAADYAYLEQEKEAMFQSIVFE